MKLAELFCIIFKNRRLRLVMRDNFRSFIKIVVSDSFFLNFYSRQGLQSLSLNCLFLMSEDIGLGHVILVEEGIRNFLDASKMVAADQLVSVHLVYQNVLGERRCPPR